MRCCSRVVVQWFPSAVCYTEKIWMWQPYYEQWETGLHGISTEFPWGPGITDLKPAQSWHSAVIHWELRRRFYVCRDVPPDFCSLLWSAGPEMCVFFFSTKSAQQIQRIVCWSIGVIIAALLSQWQSCARFTWWTHTPLDATTCQLHQHF